MRPETRRTRFSCIWIIASSGMGKPSSFSAMARFSQSFRHVWKRIYVQSSVSRVVQSLHVGIPTAGEKSWAISLLAYRLGISLDLTGVYNRAPTHTYLDKGVWYVSFESADIVVALYVSLWRISERRGGKEIRNKITIGVTGIGWFTHSTWLSNLKTLSTIY